MLSALHSQVLPCFSRAPAQRDEPMQRASQGGATQASPRAATVLQPFRSGMQLPLFPRQVGQPVR